MLKNYILHFCNLGSTRHGPIIILTLIYDILSLHVFEPSLFLHSRLGIFLVFTVFLFFLLLSFHFLHLKISHSLLFFFDVDELFLRFCKEVVFPFWVAVEFDARRFIAPDIFVVVYHTRFRWFFWVVLDFVRESACLSKCTWRIWKNLLIIGPRKRSIFLNVTFDFLQRYDLSIIYPLRFNRHIKILQRTFCIPL